MILLGLLLLLVGYLVGVGPLVSIGWVLIVIGLVLLVLGHSGVYGGPRGWY